VIEFINDKQMYLQGLVDDTGRPWRSCSVVVIILNSSTIGAENNSVL